MCSQQAHALLAFCIAKRQMDMNLVNNESDKKSIAHHQSVAPEIFRPHSALAFFGHLFTQRNKFESEFGD
jgi:hypothetical protein